MKCSRREFLKAMGVGSMALGSGALGLNALGEGLAVGKRVMRDDDSLPGRYRMLAVPNSRDIAASVAPGSFDYVTLFTDAVGVNANFSMRLYATNAHPTQAAMLRLGVLGDDREMRLTLPPGSTIANEDINDGYRFFDPVTAMTINIDGPKQHVHIVPKIIAYSHGGDILGTIGPTLPLLEQKDLITADGSHFFNYFGPYDPDDRANGGMYLNAAIASAEPSDVGLDFAVGAPSVGVAVSDVRPGSVTLLHDILHDDAYGFITGTPGMRVNHPGAYGFGTVSKGSAFIVFTSMLDNGDGTSEAAHSKRFVFNGPNMVAGADAPGRGAPMLNLRRRTGSDADGIASLLAGDAAVPSRYGSPRLNPIPVEDVPRANAIPGKASRTALSFSSPVEQLVSAHVLGYTDDVRGDNGFYDTQLSIMNPGSNDSMFSDIYIKIHTPQGIHPVAGEIFLMAGRTATVSNVLQQLGMPRGSYGALEITALLGGMHVRAITRNTRPEGYVLHNNNPVLTNDALMFPGTPALATTVGDHDGATTNIGLYTFESPEVPYPRVRFELYADDGQPLGVKTLQVPHGAYTQRNIKQLFVDGPQFFVGQLRATPLDNCIVGGCAFRVDLGSGKATTEVMKPLRF